MPMIKVDKIIAVKSGKVLIENSHYWTLAPRLFL